MASGSKDGQVKTFKTFPEFSELTFADRKAYEDLIRDYPPIADISFTMLMAWWRPLDDCKVSLLNNNLVISYWLPSLEQYSGLSLVGTSKIDESITTIFDYLRKKDQPIRLVHVPKFVLSNIHYPELFQPKEEREFDEYIFSISSFYPLSHMAPFRQKRVKQFLEIVDSSRLVAKSLDLSKMDNQKLLLRHSRVWQEEDSIKINSIAKLEAEAMEVAITHADIMGIENLCIFIDDELHGFSLHQQPSDKRYVIGAHVRINPKIPHTFDYLLYTFAGQLSDMGVSYLNLKYDLGEQDIRMFKLSLGPSNFFHKYTIEPAVKNSRRVVR